jgi:hypothetical protein
MSFKEKGYYLEKNIISNDLCVFLYNYVKLKYKVFNTLSKHEYISLKNTDWGAQSDHMMKNTFCAYGDLAMDNLLTSIKSKVENITKLKLNESYSYLRLYKKGDTLYRHLDRKECAVSLTLNLGGHWPFYFIDKNNIQVKANIAPGNALLYDGVKLVHWREELKEKECVQVFLHYVKKNKDKFDSRLHLGLPDIFKIIK